MNDPIRVYGITPAWGLPCVSPFVTKLVFGLQMAQVPFTLHAQQVPTLKADSPNGKLPYALWPDGSRLADSSSLLQRLVPMPPRPAADDALDLLAMRLVDEHLYWLGVVEPRWHEDAAWRRYRGVLFGSEDLAPEALAMAEAIRAHTLGQWMAQGLGVLPRAQREARARQDVQALAALLGREGPFLHGDRPGHADAAIAAFSAHVLEAPFESAAADAVRASPALVAHLAAYRARLPAT